MKGWKAFELNWRRKWIGKERRSRIEGKIARQGKGLHLAQLDSTKFTGGLRLLL